jgi:hypothetical protein
LTEEDTMITPTDGVVNKSHPRPIDHPRARPRPADPGSARAAAAHARPDQDTVDHRVLILSGFGAQLYEAIGGPLGEVHDATFPLPEPANPPRRAIDPAPAMTFTGRHRALLAVAATATRDRAHRHPARLVVVGPRRELRMFSRVAGSLDYRTIRTGATSIGVQRIAGVVRRLVLS